MKKTRSKKSRDTVPLTDEFVTDVFQRRGAPSCSKTGSGFESPLRNMMRIEDKLTLHTAQHLSEGFKQYKYKKL
jgi:hypothetical protein